MQSLLQKLYRLPLDMKVFIITGCMIGGIFIFPDEPENEIFFTTYLVFMFVSLAISGFFMTYVRDANYNFFRISNKTFDSIMILLLYVVVVSVISYILAITEWFILFF